MSSTNSVGDFNLDLTKVRKPISFPDGSIQQTAYIGTTGIPSLQVVLNSGNSAGTNDINLNFNDIQNVSSIELDDGINTRTITATSNPATNVDITDNTVQSTNHYLTSSSNTGTNCSLMSSTTLFPYVIPSTGLLGIQGGGLSLLNTFSSVSFAINLLILTNNNVLNSIRNFTFNITDDVNAMMFNNFRAGGIYKLFIYNNSGSAKNIAHNLGTNIRASYTASKNLNNNQFAIMNINYDGTYWFVDYTEYSP